AGPTSGRRAGGASEAPLVVDDGLDLLRGQHLSEAWHTSGTHSAGAVVLLVVAAGGDEVDVLLDVGELPQGVAVGEVGAEGAGARRLGLAERPPLGVAARAEGVEQVRAVEPVLGEVG